MSIQKLPTRQVRENCLRGLALSMQPGAPAPTHATLAFAEMVREGFPIPDTDAALCLEAHRKLDERIVEFGGESPEHRMNRMLWGGEEARRFCDEQLEAPAYANVGVVQEIPEPVLVAADIEAPDGEDYAALCDRLNRIDDATRDKLEALTQAAYLAALRRLTEASRHMVMASLKKSIRERFEEAGVSCDLVSEARALYKHNSDPYICASLVPDAVMAMLTLDEEAAITVALDDLNISVERILSDAHDQTLRALASELDIDRDELAAELEQRMAEQRAEAGLLLAAGLTAFTLSRANDITDRERLADAVIPEQLIRDTLVVAGGGQRNGNTVERNPDGEVALLVGAGLTTQAETVTAGWLAGAVDRFKRSVLLSTYEWDYHAGGTRISPRVDHQALDGLQWTTKADRERALQDLRDARVAQGRSVDDLVDLDPGVRPGSLPGCKCRAKAVTIRLVPNAR